MKRYIAALAVGLMITGLASCDKDTEGKTGITYYPVLELEGPVYDQAVAGTPWQDPGFTATLNGQDISGEVSVTTSMDIANPKPGYYTVNYSAVNSDGMTASATRYVLVTSPGDAASGYYMTDPASYRDYNGQVFYGGSYRITVMGDGTGKYNISDLLGGWYANRAGYGGNYALKGVVEINDAGDISLVSSYLSGWGDSATALTEGKFDAETGTMSWVCEYTNYPFFFHVTMTKQ